MTHLNRVFGAHVVSVLTGQYEDPEGQAIYYRIPLGAIAPDPALAGDVAAPARGARRARDRADLARASRGRSRDAPASLAKLEARGLLYGPAVNKLTLMNYVDAGDGARARVDRRARARAAAPLPDVVARRERSTRRCAWSSARASRRQVAIGLDGGYFGHTVASCRSLSIRRAHAAGPATSRGRACRTRRSPAPRRRSRRCARRSRRRAAPTRSSASSTRSCRSAPGTCCRRTSSTALEALRKELDLPLIAVETTTTCYRSGPGAFASRAIGARARRARVVGRRADRLPARRDALVRRHAAHAGVDVGRRRAVARAPASPAARGARDRRRGERRPRSTRRSRACNARGPRVRIA